MSKRALKRRGSRIPAGRRGGVAAEPDALQGGDARKGIASRSSFLLGAFRAIGRLRRPALALRASLEREALAPLPFVAGGFRIADPVTALPSSPSLPSLMRSAQRGSR